MKTIIVYTSQTGFTKKYADWLGERLSAEVLTLNEAKKKKDDYFKDADSVIYGGWAMGGQVNGSKWFMEKTSDWKDKKLALFCVGASPADNPDIDEWLKTAVSEEQKEYIKPFYCQGGLDYDKMKLPSTLAMKAFASYIKKNKTETEKDKAMGEMISSSYDISDRKYIEPIIEYIEG